jgi:hypothetical protein
VEKFVSRYGSLVTGVLSGFDRLVFRGHLLEIIRDSGMYFFLVAAKIRLLDFKDFVTATTPCSQLFDAVSRPVLDDGRRFRALRLGDPDDLALLQTISRGEFATAGFRNRDLRRLLYSSSRRPSPDELRRLCARISRRLRLLRAHGVIRKIPKTHRYRITERGQLLTAALFAARDANVKQLLAKAS